MSATHVTPEAAPGGMIAATLCALAIASVPLFHYTEGRTWVSQGLAALATGAAALSLVKRIPSFHPAVMALFTLLAFWGLTLIERPESLVPYLTLVKLLIFAVAAHVIFRTSRQLVLLFAFASATGLLSVALNWQELYGLSRSFSAGERFSEEDRFSGTFGNANSAGMYAATTLLLAFIVLFSNRRRGRWLPVLSGGLGGVAILYFTGCRKAMLALALMAIFVPWMAARQSQSGRVKWLRWGLVVIVTITTGAFLLSRLPFAERLLMQFSEGIDADSSSEQRMAMLARAFELWLEHPLLGCGFEGFAQESGFGVYSHTTFSEVLCNGGLFGMGLLSLFYIVPGVQLVALVRSGGKVSEVVLHIGLLAFWMQFVLFSLLAVMLDSVPEVCLYMAICGYLQETRHAKKRTFLPIPESAQPKAGSITGPLLKETNGRMTTASSAT